MNAPASLHHARVQAVFAGRWPDRVPICEQAFASSAASALLGREILTGGPELHYREALAGARGETAYQEFIEQVYEDSWTLTRHLDLDIWFWPWLSGRRPTRQIDERTFLYGDEAAGDWSIWQYGPESGTFGEVKSAQPPPSFEDVEALMRRALAKRPASFRGAVGPMLERALAEHGDEFPIAGNSFMVVPMQPGWLEATVLAPDLLADYLDLAVEEQLASLDAQQRAGIYFINGGGDFAFKSGPIYSPDFFDRVMAPRWQRLFDRCRELGVHYVMRSDGNLWPVAESLFGRARPQAYYEVDGDAGMRFADLRRAFPELVLVGNVSCALLHEGTPEQVRAAARECIAAAGPRVILASANAILHGTPPENVRALYESAKTYPVPAEKGVPSP